MTLAERIRRNDVEDQIYIGQLIENATKGELGTLLKLIINGIYDDQLAQSQTPNVNADRYLGRMESLKILQDRLLLAVDVKNSLVEEKRKSERVGTQTD